MRDFVLNNRVAQLDPMMQVRQAPAGMIPFASGMAVQEGNPMIPFANPDEATGMDQKILNAVFGERAMKNLKAPKVTQEEAKREIAGMEDSVNMGMASPVPQNVMNRMQKDKDKDYQSIVSDYMKKREALAKNAEERARIVGDSFLGQVDLTPAMAFVDSMHGSNLAQSYKRPETYQQNLASQQKFENQARQEYGALTDDEMNLLRQNLLGEQFKYKKKADAEDRALRRAAIESKGGQKEFSAEKLKRLDSINLAMRGLQDAKTEVLGGATIKPEMYTGVFGDDKYSASVRLFKEGIGRLQSGGAITNDEAVSFINMLPTWKDSAEIKAKKFRDMERDLNSRIENIKGNIQYANEEFNKPKPQIVSYSQGKDSEAFKQWKKQRGY